MIPKYPSKESVQGPINPETVLVGFLDEEVQVSQTVNKEMNIHGERIFPEECVGFLFGKELDGSRFIHLAKPINNAKEGDKRKRFEVSPKDYMQAELFAESQQIELIGIYHSHPNHPAIPSVHDLASAVPYFSYFILSIQEGKWSHTRSYRLSEAGKFQEERIKILNT